MLNNNADEIVNDEKKSKNFSSNNENLIFLNTILKLYEIKSVFF